MVCKGICIHHKATKPKNGYRYIIGQKRCQVCQIFIIWEGTWCPCCGYRLRLKSRNRKFKLMMLNIINKSIKKQTSPN